jgi:hypothetical protein
LSAQNNPLPLPQSLSAVLGEVRHAVRDDAAAEADGHVSPLKACSCGLFIWRIACFQIGGNSFRIAR